ncbi:SDR family NAD(P)-dependent oxidoreductase [Rhodococcus opacus]|nr:SDR family NAD(P)-dependent oxidoreductase [Rhodococcus opacus]
MGKLEGRVALVPGGASGIGKAQASLCAQEGAIVIVADRDQDGAREVAGEIAASGGTTLGLAMDVTDEDSPRVGTTAMARQAMMTW